LEGGECGSRAGPRGPVAGETCEEKGRRGRPFSWGGGLRSGVALATSQDGAQPGQECQCYLYIPRVLRVWRPDLGESAHCLYALVEILDRDRWQEPSRDLLNRLVMLDG